MSGRTRRLAWGIGLLTSTVLVLTGCGGGSSAGAGTPAASSPAASSPAAAAPASSTSATATGTTVDVTEKEFSITLAQSTFQPGMYTFAVTNQGQFPHNLTIEGPGVDTTATATLQPGQSGDVTVTLQSGSYELWCSVDSHKDRGMDMTITVA